MKPIGNYNKLPKTFKGPEKLKPGETATFRFTEDYKHLVVTSREGKIEEHWPASIEIPPTDQIFITYTENGEEVSGLFDIGLIRSVDKDGVPLAEPWWITPLGGEFYLTGGNIEDDKRYWYAMLTNHNSEREGRDNSKKAFFYRVDNEAEATSRNRKVDLELECLIFIKNLTPKEIKKLAAAFQLNENEPVSILRDKLNDFARKDAKSFNNLATSKDVEVRASIQRAFIKEVIRYAPQQHKIVWGSNNSTIATLRRVEGVTYQEQFFEWVKTAGKSGTDTLQNIEKLLEEKQ
jgi:hypothetical protein